MSELGLHGKFELRGQKAAVGANRRRAKKLAIIAVATTSFVCASSHANATTYTFNTTIQDSDLSIDYGFAQAPSVAKTIGGSYDLPATTLAPGDELVINITFSSPIPAAMTTEYGFKHWQTWQVNLPRGGHEGKTTGFATLTGKSINNGAFLFNLDYGNPARDRPVYDLLGLSQTIYSSGPDSITIPAGQVFAWDGDTSFNLGGVPEPETWGLMLIGFGILGAALRTRQKGLGTV